MPKNKVQTVPINKKVFLYILKEKNSSIRKLGAAKEISFTEKTIRRALNNGEMRPVLVKQIAIFLNIDSKLLTGEMVKNAFFSKNKEFRDRYLYPLNHLDNYPYFREEQRDLLTIKQEGLFETGGMAETIKRLLSLFEVSFSQFEKMTFDQKYDFQYELFNAMIPIIRKHFTVDAYGNTDPYSFENIINDLENYKEHHDELEYADTILREQYIEHPPKWIKKEQIEKMSKEDLLNLHIDLQMEEYYDPDYKSLFEEEYANYTIITENDTDEDILRKKEMKPSKNM